MSWIARPGSPSSLRLRAADYARLAAECRNVEVSKDLSELAAHFLALAQRIEAEQALRLPAISDIVGAGDSLVASGDERRG
jgi:hypothetical protein